MANGSVFQSSRAYRPSSSSYRNLTSRDPNSGRGIPAGWSSAAAYGKAYGQQRKLAGRTGTLGVTQKEWQNRNRGGRFNLGNLGGLLGGRSRSAEFAEQDFERQKELDRLVWERSTPDVTGVGGTVRWDRDKNMVTSTLSEENQAIYDAMFERQKRFGAEADAFSGTGWQDAQQLRFDQKRGLYAESDAQAQQQRLAREQATGASSTGRYMGAQTEQALLNQRNRELEEAAFQESQGLIDSSQRRQGLDITSMMNLGNIPNTMIKMPTPQPLANLTGISEGSTAWADIQALESAKRQKARGDAWGSILGSLFK